jgi:DtxR family Mn-dependent transcriptional regulator
MLLLQIYNLLCGFKSGIVNPKSEILIGDYSVAQIDPLLALVIAFGIIGITSLLFWPGKGIYATYRKAKKNTSRVLIEDALKHLYDYEERNVHSTLNSIAGHLSISRDDTLELVERLQSMGLVESGQDGIMLMPEGRSYALRVIRIHRLWERYLADETGVNETEWHLDAEEKEHKISTEEAEALAALMGNPIFDPHGDPIPTKEGEIPERKGVSLTLLKSGEFGRITHIEDEPQAIYVQLIAQGLHPGMQVRVIDVSRNRIKFEANGEECVLAPLFAANVHVVKIQRQEITNEFKSLSSLRKGEKAVVVGISKACRGPQRRRLMDLGVVPGTVVTAELESIGRDPVAYNIKGAIIAVRKKNADQIYIKEFSREELN